MGVTVRWKRTREKWVVTEQRDGKRYQATFNDEKEARQFAARITSQLNEDRFNGKMERKPKYTFLEGLVKWVDEYDTVKQASNINCVAAWFDENEPNAIIGPDVVSAARRMARELKDRGLSQSTINNRVQVVKRVLSLAFKEWDWLDMPLDGKLKKPAPRNERNPNISDMQIRMLLDAFAPGAERDITTLALLTGMRRGEILGLEKDNIHNGRIILRPDQTKSKKARVVPLSDEAKLLAAGAPFNATERSLRREFEKARAAIKREDLRFHDLRHIYASRLASSGESLVTIKELLGHSSLIVTSRYAHAATDRYDEIASKIPKLLSKEKRGQNAANWMGDIEAPAVRH